jgi:hypothetical protein
VPLRAATRGAAYDEAMCSDDGPAAQVPHAWHDVEPAVEIALNPGYLVPAHCTGWRAQHAMSARFPEAYVPNSVGTSFYL